MNFSKFIESKGIATKSDYLRWCSLFFAEKGDSFSHEEKSKLLFLFEKMGESGKLNYSDFLIVSLISSTGTPLNLVLTSFLLRKGADPNRYVQREGTPPIHILIYAIGIGINNSIKNSGYFTLLVNIFRYYGSILDRPAFLTEEKKEETLLSNLVSNISPEYEAASSAFRRTANVKIYSVKLWIETQLQIAITDTTTSQLEMMPEEDKIRFGVLVDSPRFALAREGVYPAFSDIILNRSIEVGKMYPTRNGKGDEKSYLLQFRGMTECLERCVSSIFIELYQYFITAGVKATYFDVNYLIGNIFLNEKESVIRSSLFELLKWCISRGVTMDLYQLRNFKDPEYSQLFNEYTSEPFWVKECRTLSIPREVEPSLSVESISTSGSEYGIRMRKLLTNLCIGIDTDKRVACKMLPAIASQKEEDVISAFKRRQHRRITDEISTPEDWLSPDGEPLFEIANREYLLSDPLSYNDLQLAFYETDSTPTSEGKIYCFTSDKFRELLRTKINPLDGTPLKPRFLLHLKNLLGVLTTIGIDPNEVENIETTLKKMKEGDAVTSFESDAIVKTVEELFLANGYGKDYFRNKINGENLSYSKEVLDVINFNQPYLILLRGESRYVTFLMAVYEGLKNSTDDERRRFFIDL